MTTTKTPRKAAGSAPDYVCRVCGKPGWWGDCHKHGFRLVANAIGKYVCGEACDNKTRQP